jgi:hypothetical protein
MMKFLQQTADDRSTLWADGSGILQWHVDATAAVHPDFRSHAGAVMSMGKGVIVSISRKQAVNNRSSTEAELVAAHDVAGTMLWARSFLQAQGYPVRCSKLHQDNRSAILLQRNGRQSAGKRSHHLNIRLFFVADQVKKGIIDIAFCPTDEMTGDDMTKPLHGKKFVSFRNEILYLPSKGPSSAGPQKCVESYESKVNGSSQDPDATNSDIANSDVEADWTIVKRRRRRQ